MFERSVFARGSCGDQWSHWGTLAKKQTGAILLCRVPDIHFVSTVLYCWAQERDRGLFFFFFGAKMKPPKKGTFFLFSPPHATQANSPKAFPSAIRIKTPVVFCFMFSGGWYSHAKFWNAQKASHRFKKKKSGPTPQDLYLFCICIIIWDVFNYLNAEIKHVKWSYNESFTVSLTGPAGLSSNLGEIFFTTL